MKRIFGLSMILAGLLNSHALFAAESLAELRSRAENGNVVAQYNLGLRYADGEGVAKDLTEGGKWIRRAAEQGNVDAQ